MSETILDTEATIRLAIFLGVLAAMALWEVAAPRRRREIPRVIRWTNNLALVVVDTIILRLSFPILAVGLAVMAEDRGWGLFNNLDVPVWLAIIVSMLLLDLAIYLQHVMFHAVPGLWRLHRMHHADLDIDASTGLRFHPLEIMLNSSSMAIEVRPRAVETRAELDALIACGIDGAAEVEKQVRQHLAYQKDRPVTPFDTSSCQDVLKLIARSLDSKGVYLERGDTNDFPEPGEQLVVSESWLLYTRPKNNNFLVEDLRRLRHAVPEGSAA